MIAARRPKSVSTDSERHECLDTGLGCVGPRKAEKGTFHAGSATPSPLYGPSTRSRWGRNRFSLYAVDDRA
jgi:hypothetical protein